jgi:hypothetical protein
MSQIRPEDGPGRPVLSYDGQHRVAERREQLYQVMSRLEAAAARPTGSPDWRSGVEAALEDLDEALRQHVEQVEGEGGLFEDVHWQAPHLDHQIETLREEHEEVLAASRWALRMVDEWEPAVLRRRVNGLLARLAVHRQTGAELLYDAYSLDLGGLD